MEKQKRRRGDRRDGYLIRDLDGFHVFIPYLMPYRADCEASIREEIDLTNALQYLEKKNAEGPATRYTVFQLVAAAAVKTVTLRPWLNRFIAGKRVYQRNNLSLAFVAKKRFEDSSEEALMFMEFPEDATIDSIHQRIEEEVTGARSGQTEDNSMNFINILARFPRCILRVIMWTLRSLDYYGKAPYMLVKTDPDFASVYISNLGSIGLNAGYHHLNNWGTNSLFIVIGQIHKKPFYDDEGNVTMRPVVELGLTLDERLADGYYYARSVKLMKHLLHNPELLELPAKEEVDYE